MTDRSEQSQPLNELAHLPPVSPMRPSLRSQLSLLDQPEREYWEAFLNETDEIYNQVSQCEVPQDLERTLLRIPDLRPRTSWLGRALAAPVGWKHIAACLLLLIGLTFVVSGSLFRSNEQPNVPPLDDELAGRICKLAVQEHQVAADPPTKASDPRQLELALAGHKLTFQVSILHPEAELELLGGGVSDFGGAPAVFSRWQAGGLPYTLIQFDAKQLGVPLLFPRIEKDPSQLSHDGIRYRVVIWPGSDGRTAWALVMQSDAARDLFSVTCH